MKKFYVVYGDPIALARARVCRGRFYDSQHNTKLVVGINLKNQHEPTKLLNGPLFMDVIFYFPIPTTYSKKKVALYKDQWHIYKPDSSNLLKFIEDVATTICYHDDCIIAKQLIEKCYDDGNGPRTEFILEELKGPRQHRDLNGKNE